MDLEPGAWSFRRPANLVAFSLLWLIGVIATFVVGFSWKALGIAIGVGVLLGFLYSPGRYLLRILGFVALFGGMGIARDVWTHANTVGVHLLINAQFLAVGLTIAALIQSLLPSKRRQSPAAGNSD